jgi:hypothetical protein
MKDCDESIVVAGQTYACAVRYRDGDHGASCWFENADGDRIRWTPKFSESSTVRPTTKAIHERRKAS